MDKATIGRIISGVIGLALVGFGVYLVATEGSHGEALIMAGIAIAGGLGTAGLPAAFGPGAAKRESGGPRIPPGTTLMLALALAVGGCSGGAAAAGSAIITAAPKVRDLSCRGARLVCRWADTACRATGGPAVLPENEAEDTGGGEVTAESEER